ncbi:MAG: hypothetical protein C0411_10230 [Pseudomonas sp.]|nr:hypothetical protein [Pseudomonas sp.]
MLWATPIPVGVSLLAIAVFQSTSMLTDPPLSRAGSLLQLFCVWLEPFRYSAHLYYLSQNKNKEPSCSISARSPKPMPSAGLHT